MLIELNESITQEQKQAILKFLNEKGHRVRELEKDERCILAVLGLPTLTPDEVRCMPGVGSVTPIKTPYELASRETNPKDTVIDIGGVIIGAGRLAVMAGPCGVESREQIIESARIVHDSGAVILRGGAFKPRTSPYAFQGLGEKGLGYLKEAGSKFGMPVVSEIVDGALAKMMSQYVDIFQIGTRNMQNFELLKQVGSLGMPVILKRGMSAMIEEWLMAAEYLMAHGTDKVILCERGIRTFEHFTRNTLDLSAIPVVKQLSHLPVIVDPSHATGSRAKVPPMALAAASAGADGLIVEVHPDPDNAASDGPQSLYSQQFEKLMRDLEVLCPVLKKELERPQATRRKLRNITMPESPGDELLVAFQGEHGAFSEKALFSYFQEKQVKSLPCHEFRDVFKAVLEGRADYGIIPMENSLAGSIHENYDLFMEFVDLSINGEKKLRVEHSLIGLESSDISQIRQVYSHPQALAQCAHFLEKQDGWETKPFYDTAGSSAFIAEKADPALAAISDAGAASFYNLKVLKEGIENNPQNYTRFFVISRGKVNQDKDSKKVSIIYSVSDKSGALFRSLDVLAKRNINLSKLESRPLLGKPWQYMFYLDLDIPEKEGVLESGFEELQEVTEDFRILGYYLPT